MGILFNVMIDRWMEGRKEKKDRQIGERVVMGKEGWMDRRMGREVSG